MDGCLAIYAWENSTNCLRCDETQHFDLDGQTCKCMDGYTVTTQKCINIIGCLTSRTSSNQLVCVACNVPAGFITLNGQCVCKPGFQLNGTICVQKCGDGTLFYLDCDDGNNVDGDGCSSKCKVEMLYKCYNGSETSPSICKYYGRKIKLSVSKIKKLQMVNQGIFQFKISPVINALAYQNLNQTIVFSCQQSIKKAKALYSNGILKVYIDYFEDLEGRSANMTLLLNSTYFQL